MKKATDRFRTAPADRYDVIIVGSGPGGLVAAALLANRGQRVLVLDQHYVAGGNSTLFRRRGYEFDVGVHYIGECRDQGMIARIMRACGATGVEYEELDPDGFDTLVFPEMRFRVPTGIERYRERLLEHFPSERPGIDRYIAFMRQLEALQQMAKKPWLAPLVLARSGLILRWGNSTFNEFIDTCTKDMKLRAVLVGNNGDYGEPPSKVSSLMAVGLTLHYMQGAYFPRGGGQALSDALAASVERAGGRILLRSRVRQILVNKGRATGVEFENPHLGVRRVEAKVVISNADLKRTWLELIAPAHVSPATVARVRKFEMAAALGVVFLGVRRDVHAEGHRRTNYWIYPSWDMETYYKANEEGRLADRPLTYVSIASVKDPTNRRAAPPGMTNLQVLSLAPSAPEAWGVTEEEVLSGAYRRSAAYEAKKEAYAERLLEEAEQVLPGLRGQIEFREVATPLTHRRYTLSTDGTSYGIAHTPAQFLWKRPGTHTEIDNLYLCGASCRMGHGIGGAMASGVEAAAAVLGGEVRKAVDRGEARLFTELPELVRAVASSTSS